MVPLKGAGPSLAVVFGSGGLPAIAGLGVVDAVHNSGLVPDLYAGSGAGAVFAALLAGGRSVEDSVVLASRLWTPQATVQRRWLAAISVAWPSLARPGARFSLLREGPLVRRLEAAFGRTRIEDLAIALRICATDAATGETVILDRGRLSDALRASMAQPMLLPPVSFGGRMLIAGAQSDPLPVGTVTDARCVLAVLAPRRAPTGPETLLHRLQATMAAQAGQLVKSHLQAAH
ncbi:MAG: patatin-like phospholipase family protein, partial [Burkholderiaceae bacterium]